MNSGAATSSEVSRFGYLPMWGCYRRSRATCPAGLLHHKRFEFEFMELLSGTTNHVRNQKIWEWRTRELVALETGL